MTANDSVSATQDTTYAYNVLVQSPVNTVPGFAATTWKTGLEWLVEVDIGWPSDLFDEISVNLSYDEPAHSIGTFLASNDVKPEWVLEPFRVGDEQTPESVIKLAIERQQVPDRLRGEPLTLAQRKLFALKYFAQKPFRSERRLGKIVLHDDGTRGDRKAGDGIFSSSEAPAVLNGGYYEYTVGVDAVARMALQRSCFNRQIVVSKFATAVLDADAIKTNLEIKLATEELFFDRSIWNNLGGIPRVAVRTAVLFTPQVGGVSWLPGRAAEIDLDVKNGTVVVPFTDNWNGGTYIAVVEHSAEITPSVVVSVGGVRSKEMLLGDSITYCLQKYTFPEVERNANQLHIEFNVPNVRTTNQGPFVKTVTKGNKVILSRPSGLAPRDELTLEFERKGSFTIDTWYWVDSDNLTIGDKRKGPPSSVDP